MREERICQERSKEMSEKSRWIKSYRALKMFFLAVDPANEELSRIGPKDFSQRNLDGSR